MRKVELELLGALKIKGNFSTRLDFIEYDQENDCHKCYLHGTHIATVYQDRILFNCVTSEKGWGRNQGYGFSQTTKNRLNVYLSLFNCFIVQDHFVPMFNRDQELETDVWYIYQDNKLETL